VGRQRRLGQQRPRAVLMAGYVYVGVAAAWLLVPAGLACLAPWFK